MNDIYLYQYSNGQQFLSNAKPDVLSVSILARFEQPKIVGRWKYKKMKMPIPDNSHLFRS